MIEKCVLAAHDRLSFFLYIEAIQRRREVSKMPNYVINKQKTDGRYNEVHRTDCSRVPSIYNRESIGWHANEIDAVHYAQNIGYPAADGCYYCCPRAHKD